ncbi:unnamed protein product [Cunninghamella echinulata]
MNTDINCIAIIGKQNNPLFIKNFSSTHPDLKYHYIAHTSIDVIEERDLAVYGYMTNTKVKFIVVVSVTDGTIRDTDMKTIFKKIHNAYVSQVCNPFYNMTENQPFDDLLPTSSFLKSIELIGNASKTSQSLE